MIGASEGLPLKVVMILGRKTHLVLVTRPEITSLKELKGKTIGVTRPGSDVHRMLGLVVKSVGIDPGNLTPFITDHSSFCIFYRFRTDRSHYVQASFRLSAALLDLIIVPDR
jgi:NMT1/THI5 like